MQQDAQTQSPPVRSRTTRRARPWLIFLCAVAMGATLAAVWVLPVRMAFEPGCSYYTFNLICDETCYALKLAPPIAGTNALNPSNGLCDPNILSPFYLEALGRALVMHSGLDVITCFWIWRWAFPFGCAISMGLLARACLPRRRSSWTLPLIAAASAAATALLYVFCALLLPAPPGHWLNRIPTNIEFPLSVAVLAAFVSLLRVPGNARAIRVVALLLILTYLRPYAALPLCASIALSVSWLAFRRQIAWRVVFLATAVFLLGMLPWFLTHQHNQQSPVYREMFARCFRPERPYFVFPRWPAYLLFAAAIAGMASALRGRCRVFLIGAAVMLAALPFVSGLTSIKIELMHHLDRFGCFYLPVLLCAGLLWLGERSAAWSGWRGWRSARTWTAGLCGVALLSAVVLAGVNVQYDFARDYVANRKTIADDQPFLPAYNWVREHTPAAALFLVDDGVDWGELQAMPDAIPTVTASVWDRVEFFQLIARRRAVFEERMHGYAIAQADLLQAWNLHRGTFGLAVDPGAFVTALKRFRPQYVLWRRRGHVPRGFGSQFQRGMATSVYTDDVCEIWRLSYSESEKAQVEARGKAPSK